MSKQEDLLRGKVRDLSGEGWGVVSEDDGTTYFVRGAWPGDEISFEVLSKKGKYGEGRIKEIFRASPDRRSQVPCPYQGFEIGKCGGCPWMVATYSGQLRFKQSRLKYLLDRFHLPSHPEVLREIWASPEEFQFRNRAQFKTDGKKLGYVSPESNHLVDIEKCLVLNTKMSENLDMLRASLPEKDWEPDSKHLWNYLDVDEDQSQNFPKNIRRPFKQGNNFQNKKMQEWLRSRGQELDKSQGFAEFFAGGGNFTEVLSQLGFQEIFAAEIASQSLEQLKSKNLSHVKIFEGDLSKRPVLRDLGRKIGPETRYLLLDPPREGAPGLEEFTKKAFHLEKIFYISCDVRSWVRDVLTLKDFYRVTEIQPVDQFPQTPHLEILSVLEKIQ